MALRPGLRVADVGAGDGEWAERLARRVGDAGHVWATEVEDDKVEQIASRLERAGVSNASVLLGSQRDTGLPPACCDAILLRLVYHHFQDPDPMRESLKRALRPGGRLVVLDVPPQTSWSALAGVPDRGGHGIALDDLVAELTADGFRLVSRDEAWDGDETEYCAVFELASAPR
jgi:ubiquinone/menaquinone biosynthesis C-methylase UbiE